LFWRLKQKLFGTALNSEQNVLEMVTKVLSELPQNEVKSTFFHWKEGGQWVADHNGEFYPK
jgi:hypothetical protein